MMRRRLTTASLGAPMRIVPSRIPEVVRVEPKVFGDPRGFFFELHSEQRFAEAGLVGLDGKPLRFVQDNVSRSSRGVLRGLHFQKPATQTKLVSVLEGVIFDVAVDLRAGSPTFGQWISEVLGAEDHHQLLVPRGFAHGFQVVSETAIVHYKVDDFYAPAQEHGVAWDDPDLGIPWPVAEPTLSQKDRVYPRVRDLAPELRF